MQQDNGVVAHIMNNNNNNKQTRSYAAHREVSDVGDDSINQVLHQHSALSHFLDVVVEVEEETKEEEEELNEFTTNKALACTEIHEPQSNLLGSFPITTSTSVNEEDDDDESKLPYSLVASIQSRLQRSLRLTRRSQQEELLQAYHRCCRRHGDDTTATSEFILITGPSGSGKSHLVKTTLQEAIQQRQHHGHGHQGTLISGKFDPLQLPEPYSAFIDAFTEFAATQMEATSTTKGTTNDDDHNHLLRSSSSSSINSKAILEAVGKDGAIVLTDMIPALERVIGRGLDDDDDDDDDARNNRNNISTACCEVMDCSRRVGAYVSNSFVRVFCQFVKAVSSPERPLLILLENMQWADPSSLDLLTSLLTDQDLDGVLFVGTFDDITTTTTTTATNTTTTTVLSQNDDDNGDITSLALSQMLQKLNFHDVSITNIPVTNFSLEEINDLLQPTLQEQSSELAEFIASQTKGNLFYMMAFLRWLEEEQLLVFDSKQKKWKWDAHEIALTVRCNSVEEFMADQLESLPIHVQEVLKVASCIGPRFNLDLLRMVLVDSDSNVQKSLDIAMKRGLLRRMDQLRQATEFRFPHDIAQTAAYALIAPEARSSYHLTIARKIWHQLDGHQLEKHLFTVISQFCLCDDVHHLIQDQQEKVAVATLCLHAGRKAAKCSAFHIASTYLDIGIKVLGPEVQCWREHYALSLDLHNAAAEMELCTANFQRMDELLDSAFTNIHNFRDKIQAYATRIYSLGVRDRQQQAIEEGKNVLRELGEPMPTRFRLSALLREVISIRRLLRSKSDSMLMRLPPMLDPSKFAAIRILDLMFLSSRIAQPSYVPLIMLRMMKVTLQYGSSPWTANAFAAYGILCCTLGRVDEGYNFGQLALKLIDASQGQELLPRVYGAVYGCIYSFKSPIHETIEPLLHAHRIGLETGDLEFSFLNANFLCVNSFEAGTPLPQIEKSLKGVCDVMRARQQQPLLRLAMIILQTIHHLMGFTDNPLSLSGDVIDFGMVSDVTDEANTFAVRTATGFRRSFLAYLFDDFDLANDVIQQWRGEIFRIPISAVLFSASFLDGLVALACARQHRHKRTKFLRVANVQIRRFKKWASDSPQNCLDKLFLLEAERASILGNHKVAFEKYTCANALAADSGCLWSQAIANERAAEHLAKRGEHGLSHVFLRRACDTWERWGASAKSNRLKANLDNIIPT